MVAESTLSSPSCSLDQEQYDVFLSFRGEDTRLNFTSHLHAALCRKSIFAFIDDKKIERGDEISSTLLNAINKSKISIVIFSENYATSRWCLDELVRIMECKKTVIPVFYHIDPTHVRNQSGPFENAFANHEIHNQFKVQKWRTTLKDAGNIAGWTSSNRSESDLIEDITEEVSTKLNHVSNPKIPSSFVGIGKHVEQVESLLRIGSEDVRIVGIWGMGGIGKTTIAEILFKTHSAQFEGCYFLENVREEWKKQGKKKLQKKLLSKIFGDQRVHMSTPSISSTFAVERLRRRRVLIVLDDVNNTQQIEYLVGEKAWFGLGSRIIVTLRDKDVLNENDGLYKVEQMDNEEALQFFSLKAFGQDQPKWEFIDLSKMVVNYATGNPLALKVLGSLLHSKNQQEWKSMLKKLEKVPNKDIEYVLRLSFEELDHEEQQIFLDIACCLKGQTKWDIINLLDGYGYSTTIGLRSLENKSLITTWENHVQMHDLIQKIGFQVVRQEFPKELEKRSRLWDPDKIYRVFRRKRDVDYSVETLLLNMAEIKKVEIDPAMFNRMQKLRILKFYLPHYGKSSNVHLTNGLESLPDELRCLHWDLFPLKCLPPSFCPEMLVQVNLQGSLIEKLREGEQDLTNMKSLNLSCCVHLIELPNLSQATNLEEIHLDNCVSLRDVPLSMLSLDSLVALNLSNCRKLQCIRSDNRSIQWLNLSGCSRLAEFSVNSENLEFLSMEGTAIEKLPLSVERAKNLHRFYFSKCERLENLPENFYQIGLETWDVQIYFDDCPKLKKLPSISDTSFPITILHLDGCSNLSELPKDLGHLLALHELSVQGSGIEALPPSIKLLSHLQILNVRNCKRLQFLPELPLSIAWLYATGCISLETVPSSAANALIQEFFGSSNLRLLQRQVQESKGSFYWGRCREFVDFLNCTRLEENACKTLVAEALTRMKYVAYVLPILKENAKCDPCDHELNEDLFDELLAGVFKMPFDDHGTIFPSWFQFRGNTSFYSPSCSSCSGWYTAFDLLKEQYWTNTHYGLGSQRICLDLMVGSLDYYYWPYWFHAVDLYLPGSRVPSCFKYRTTGACLTLELPPRSDFLGLAFCLVFSPESQFAPSLPILGTKLTGTVFGCEDIILSFPAEPMISDHVYLCYDFEINCSLVGELEEREANNQCTTDNLKLSFEFYSDRDGRKDGIKECGALPLYASDIASELSTCPDEIEIEETNYKTSVLSQASLDITRLNIIRTKFNIWNYREKNKKKKKRNGSKYLHE